MTTAAGRILDATSRMRARRRAGRRRSLGLAAAAVLAAGLVTAAAWAALWSPLFAVRTVTVEGTSRLTPADVAQQAAVTRGESLLRLDPATIEARVSTLPAVAAVDVRRDWPHGVVISVVERQPVAVVPDAGGGELLDAGGTAFAHESSPPGGLVPVQVDGPVPGAGEAPARAAVTAYSALPDGLRKRVSAVRAPSIDAVSFVLRDGREIVWGSAQDAARKLAALRPLLRQPAHVYDVSAPAVVVTR